MKDSSGFLRRRARSTFFTSIISISLVLFFLCMFLGTGLFMRAYLRQIQEDFELMLSLADEIAPERMQAMEAELKSQSFTKSLRFVSKEEAAKEFQIYYVGEDFLSLMDGVNPMHPSFRLKLKAEFLEGDSLRNVKAFLAEMPGIGEVDSPDEQIDRIRKNSNLLIRIAAGMALIVILIAWFLIGGTIRLAVFARRFSIRTMQLIGATNRFIRRPFLRMGILQGLLGGIFGAGGFFGLGWGLSRWDSRFSMVKEVLLSTEGVSMLAGIIIFGAVLGFISSSFAVNRFLNQPLENVV